MYNFISSVKQVLRITTIPDKFKLFLLSSSRTVFYLFVHPCVSFNGVHDLALLLLLQLKKQKTQPLTKKLQ